MKISTFLTNLFPPPKPITPDEELAAELKHLVHTLEQIGHEFNKRGYEVSIKEKGFYANRLRLTWRSLGLGPAKLEAILKRT